MFCLVVKEAGGSDGMRSEVFRLYRFDPKFSKGLGFVNKIAAQKANKHCVGPLIKLKRDVERLLKEYKPPEHVVEELDLTWRGGLWRMALEAALGVQYLHHHRYERRDAREKRIGLTNSSFTLTGTGATGGSGTTGPRMRSRRRRRGGRSR
jgi:hypothetical protein